MYSGDISSPYAAVILVSLATDPQVTFRA